MIQQNDIPQQLLDVMQRHIDALRKPQTATGFKGVSYQSGKNTNGFKFRGFVGAMTPPHSGTIRLVFVNIKEAAALVVAAAEIDPRLRSQKSASIWLLWMIEKGAAAVDQWLEDEGVQRGLEVLPVSGAQGGRPSGSSQAARDLLAQDPNYSEQAELNRRMSDRKQPQRSSVAGGSSSVSAGQKKVESEEEEEALPSLGTVPTPSSGPKTEQEKKRLLAELYDLLGGKLTLNEIVSRLEANDWDEDAILEDHFWPIRGTDFWYGGHRHYFRHLIEKDSYLASMTGTAYPSHGTMDCVDLDSFRGLGGGIVRVLFPLMTVRWKCFFLLFY